MDGSVMIGVGVDVSGVASALNGIRAQMNEVGIAMAQSLSLPADAGANLAAQFTGRMVESVNSASGAVQAAVSGLAGAAISAFSMASWYSAGAGAGSAMADGVRSGSGGIISAASSVASQAASAFSSGSWSSIGSGMMSGVASGILSAGYEIVAAIERVSAQAEAALKRYYGIHSPSVKMRDEVGVMISRGIAEGITSGSGYIQAAMGSVFGSMGAYPAPVTSTLDRGYAGGSQDGRMAGSVVQNIYLRDNESSPYASAKRIRRESESAFRR